MVRAGFSRKEVRDRFETIDHANVPKLGFSKRRFPQSMFETYRALCFEHAKHFDRSIARRARAIGTRVFDVSPRILRGVNETLSKLRAQGVRLVLATKGDSALQRHRIKQSGLRHYFDRVYIFPRKGTTEFKRILGAERLDHSISWSIGNSIKSDINPALAAGINAIWIPRKTWVYEDEEPVANARLCMARSIREVPGIIFRRR